MKRERSVKHIIAVHTGSEQDVYRDLAIQFMQDKKIKQIELAEKLDVDYYYFNRWLHGKLEFGKKPIRRLERELFS